MKEPPKMFITRSGDRECHLPFVGSKYAKQIEAVLQLKLELQ